MNILTSLSIGTVVLLTTISSLISTGSAVVTHPSQVVQQVQNAVASSSSVSRNWAGYTAANGTFTGVSGTWTIPQVNGNNNYGSDVAWVGIGGVSSTDLIQAGTQDTVSRNGQVSYQAFYETLPDASLPLRISVNGGDSVTVSVSQQSSGQWQITFKDNTTGGNVTQSVAYNSSLSSAEWIEEAPSGFRRVLPLDNFGSIQFSNTTAIKNGQTVTPSQANAQAVTMGNSFGQTLATASVLGGDGASFSVTGTNQDQMQQDSGSSYTPFYRRIGGVRFRFRRY